jgi:hypothetical protein
MQFVLHVIVGLLAACAGPKLAQHEIVEHERDLPNWAPS